MIYARVFSHTIVIIINGYMLFILDIVQSNINHLNGCLSYETQHKFY
jgi:hypothetical protein